MKEGRGKIDKIPRKERENEIGKKEERESMKKGMRKREAIYIKRII